MFTGDKAFGMVGALAKAFPDAAYQRCTVHFYRNVFSNVPKSKRKLVTHLTYLSKNLSGPFQRTGTFCVSIVPRSTAISLPVFLQLGPQGGLAFNCVRNPNATSKGLSRKGLIPELWEFFGAQRNARSLIESSKSWNGYAA